MAASGRRIAVVGGGITGLAAAHHLHELSRAQRRPVEIVIFEASDRPGGVICSLRHGGFLVETGPDSLIREKPWAVRLAKRLGLADEIVGTQDQHRRSFVVRGGRLHPTPDGFELLAPTRFLPLLSTPLFSPLGKLRMGLDLLLPRGGTGGDESVGRFVLRRLGREALERFAQPMVTAIYGADPMKLSLAATFPRFLEMEAESRSVIKAMWLRSRRRRRERRQEIVASGARYSLFETLAGGLEDLVRELVRRVPAEALRLSCPVRQIRPGEAGEWRVATGPGEEVFDGVIMALPAPQAAGLIRGFDGELGAMLASIPYGAAATVSLGFREEDVPHPLDGFGFVVPWCDEFSILGCTFAHRKYPGRAPAGHALLRGFHGDDAASLPADNLVEATRRDLRRLLGVTVEPLFARVARYPLSLPQYGVGHLDLVSAIEQRVVSVPGLALAGNAYRGVGVPDCVRSGEAAAAALFNAIG